MKKFFVLILIVASLFGNFENFTKKATIKPELVQTGKGKMWCPVCGMSLKMFYKTSHASKLEDGTNRQYCSMRCLLVDMKHHKIDINSIKVVDVVSQKLILAKDATYVVGSKIKGTMSKVSKLAFKNRSDAEKFTKIYGGKIMSFQEALMVAKKGLKKDIAMINRKKQKMVYPKGKMIYTKKCKSFKIDLTKFKQINELKAYIVNNHLCKVKGKPLQMVSLYLWEVKRLENSKIKVSKKDKCPVCGMFVYKYPRWAALIEIKTNSHIHKYVFDGAKDMFKFYFNPNKYVHTKGVLQNMLVTNYYTLQSIKAENAIYVIGSDVYGPMGKEFIPFSTIDEAKSFIKDHAGRIIRFNQITTDIVFSLDS